MPSEATHGTKLRPPRRWLTKPQPANRQLRETRNRGQLIADRGFGAGSIAPPIYSLRPVIWSCDNPADRLHRFLLTEWRCCYKIRATWSYEKYLLAYDLFVLNAPRHGALQPLSLHFKDYAFKKMHRSILLMFIWAVEGLSKINDSCSFVDVGQITLDWYFLTE